MKVFITAGAGLAAVYYGVANGQIVPLVLGVGLILAASSGVVNPFYERLSVTTKSILGRIGKPAWLLFAVISLALSGAAGIIATVLPLSPWSAILWLGALASIIAGVLWHDRLDNTDRASVFVNWRVTDWVLLVILAGIAFGLRVYLIDAILPPFHGDEGEMGDLALRVFQNASLPFGRQVLLFNTAFLGHPTLFYYLQAGAMLVFGKTEIGLRLLSILSGTLCVALVYLVARMVWSTFVATLAAWLMAVSHLYIHYSRIALNNIETVLAMIFMVFIFGVIYQQNNRSRLFWPMVGGLCLGLAQYFYYGSRLLLVVAPVLIVALYLIKRIGAVQIGVVALGLVVSYLPQLIYYQSHMQTFTGRAETVLVFTDQNVKHTLGPEAKLPDDLPALILHQTQATLGLMWPTGKGDSSAFYWPDISGFDLATEVLLWIGMLIMLIRIKNYHYFSLFACFWIGIAFSGIFTNDAPNGPRMIVGIWPVFLIAATPVQEIERFLDRFRNRIVNFVLVGLAAAIALFALSLNFETYFNRYQTHVPNSLATIVARKMVAEGEHCTFYLYGLPYLSSNYGSIRFIAREVERNDVKAIDELPSQTTVTDSGRDICIIVLPAYEDQIEALKARYSISSIERQYDTAGRPMFTFLDVTP